MKILQINSHYDMGGAAKIVSSLHKQLLREGEESFVAYGRGPKTDQLNIYRFNQYWEVLCSALISRVFGVHGWSNRMATKRLLRYVDRVKPDIIHMHALHGYYLNLPLFFEYINSRKIPCVWTFHDCFAFTGNCGYSFDCEKWKEGCGHCPYIANYPKSQCIDASGWMWKRKKALFTVGDNKVLVSPSDWLREQAEVSFLKKYPCITIHNGINVTDVFYPREKEACRTKYGLLSEEKLILGVAAGFGDKRKGAVYLLRLARALGQEAKVILIGWEKKYDHLLSGLDNVIALPNIMDEQVLAEYYSMADLFVLPSLAENYATVVLEAMACGTPVVGFKVGGVGEQLTDGRGIAVEAGDEKALEKAVRKALQPDSGLLKGGQLASVIQKENAVEQMTKEYIRVYRSLYDNNKEQL